MTDKLYFKEKYSPGIVPYIIELLSVIYGIKPGCRIVAPTNLFNEITSFAASNGLSHASYFHKKKINSSFIPYSIDERKELLKKEYVHVYIAKSGPDAKNLMHNEALKYDYKRFGQLLGYPECCIEFASAHDGYKKDTKTGYLKQENLITYAIRHSHKIDFRCNKLIQGSSLADYSPVDIFSHYPCSFNCVNTISYSNEVLSLIKQKFNNYYDTLIEKLKYPAIYFPDENYPVEYITDYNGIIIDGEIDLKNKSIHTVKNVFSMYSPLFSSYKNISGIKVVDDKTYIDDKDTTAVIDNTIWNLPVLFDWKTNSFN